MPPATIPAEEPTRARLGDTWRWDRKLDDYTPAGGWAAFFRLRGKSALDVTGAANTSSSGWEFTVAKTDTLKLKAGDYDWTLEVSQGAERFTILSGVLVALVDLTTATAGALVSFEARIIELLEAFLAGATEDGILESVIAGRQVRLMSALEARQLLIQFRNDQTKRRNGGRFAPIETVFTPL